MTYDNQLHEAFIALADPTRRGIFETLRHAPQSVSQIAAGQTVSRPAVSQHLKALQNAGLVSATAKGTRNIYAIRREGLQPLRSYLDQFWGDVLDAYKEEIETHYGANNDKNN